MPRLTAEQWSEIRQRREAGESYRSLASAFGVSNPAICKRANAEGWGDGFDIGLAIRARVAEKVSGISSDANEAEKELAIEAAATSGADLITRQQLDWELHRRKFATVTADIDTAKHAKLNAEHLSLLHAGERKSHGLSDTALPLADAETEAAQRARTQTAMIAINNLLSQIVIEKHFGGNPPPYLGAGE